MEKSISVKPEDYFPFICDQRDHDYIEKGKFPLAISSDSRSISEFFTKLMLENCVFYNEKEDIKVYEGKSALFSKIVTKNISYYQEFAKDPNSVMIVLPRHRSLIDFIAAQQVHYFLVNPETILMSGSNLLVGSFKDMLRKYGAFRFIRKSKKHVKGLPDLTAKDYFLKVFVINFSFQIALISHTKLLNNYQKKYLIGYLVMCIII